MSLQFIAALVTLSSMRSAEPPGPSPSVEISAPPGPGPTVTPVAIATPIVEVQVPTPTAPVAEVPPASAPALNVPPESKAPEWSENWPIITARGISGEEQQFYLRPSTEAERVVGGIGATYAEPIPLQTWTTDAQGNYIVSVK